MIGKFWDGDKMKCYIDIKNNVEEDNLVKWENQ